MLKKVSWPPKEKFVAFFSRRTQGIISSPRLAMTFLLYATAWNVSIGVTKTFWTKILRCLNVFHDHALNGTFIEGLPHSICPSMHPFCNRNKDALRKKLVFEATLHRKLHTAKQGKDKPNSTRHLKASPRTGHLTDVPEQPTTWNCQAVDVWRKYVAQGA